MDRGSTTKERSETGDPGDPAPPRVATPDVAARRDLIAWCQSHGLPVPPERTAPDVRGSDAAERR